MKIALVLLNPHNTILKTTLSCKYNSIGSCKDVNM